MGRSTLLWRELVRSTLLWHSLSVSLSPPLPLYLYCVHMHLQ